MVNPRNQVVSTIGDFLYRITEPALRPIRNMLPNLGGIDISPVILILIISLSRVIVLYILPTSSELPERAPPWTAMPAMACMLTVRLTPERRARRASTASRIGRRPCRAQGAGAGCAERRRGQRRAGAG